ncbi:MAG: RNA polymerase sigma factor [Acidobacteriota bacterium]|jgi:RNA polymerase sigma-70 factor (ECF subfamily)|nr:RNA polymerase sigma factor [Acidobacteriota bacterium]MDQ3374640.1 RNA polymerase sigma factor [Acidobacteriota bacterium]
MDDSAAIERCQNGDREAFRYLVECYQGQAVGHAVAILGNREDALDAVQEAFIDAFKALARFDRTRRFYPWFYVLLRHRCFKMTAKKRETQTIEEIEILAPQVGLPPEEQIALETALLDLSKEDRELVTLKYLNGLSYNEIAEQLEIPQGTVMSRLFYARKQLQAKLTKTFH